MRVGSGLGAGRVDKAVDGIEAHRAVGRGDAGAEGDGRDVAFAGGAEAEDDAQLAGTEAGLVGRRNDAGVEEGAGLERILVGEIRTDEKFARFADCAVDR